MSDTNYIGSIVKILEKPIETLFEDISPITTVRVQLPQIRNSTIINLVFWGKLASEVATYYKTNDYIIIEGYLSLRDQKVSNITSSISKKVEVTVLKIYPFLLS